MAEKKNFFPDFRIYSPADLGKQWFVFWNEHGRRRKKYGRINQGATYADRMKEAVKLIEELRGGYKPEASPIQEEIRRWLESNRPFWKKKTVQSYTSVIDTFFSFLGRREVSRDTIMEFFRDRAQVVSGTTYNNYRAKLLQALSAVGVGDMIEGIGKVKADRQPARYFQRHQVERLKRHISQVDNELWLFVQFLFYCFIRPGELRLLRASDVLLDERKILVRAEVSKNRRNQYVAIPEAFFPSLVYVRELRPDVFLFPSPMDASKPIGLNTMSGRHRSILRELGFSVDYKLYSWKHTGAVMAVMAGVTIKELQMQLRHHSLDQVNEYLRQMGIQDMATIMDRFPSI